MIASDIIPAIVDCSYSNIGEEWSAEATAEHGEFRLAGRGKTRPEALRNLADKLEDWQKE